MSKNQLLFVFVFTSLIFSGQVSARMYQWVDPDTGTTQLSGKPPAWYRSGQAGPRIIVLDNGKVVDDTALEVSEQEQGFLRQTAFIKAEENQEIVRQQILQSKRIQAALTRTDEDNKDNVEEEQLADILPEEEIIESGGEVAKSDEETKQELQALIRKWEDQKAEDALKLLQALEEQ